MWAIAHWCVFSYSKRWLHTMHQNSSWRDCAGELSAPGRSREGMEAVVCRRHSATDDGHWHRECSPHWVRDAASQRPVV